MKTPNALRSRPIFQGGISIREAYHGPVFSLDSDSQTLYMRYTERLRYITWRSDPALEEAKDFIRETLNTDNPWVVSLTLEPGQGVICNNSLHCREHYQDNIRSGQKRRLYRIRFQDRIQPYFQHS